MVTTLLLACWYIFWLFKEFIAFDLYTKAAAYPRFSENSSSFFDKIFTLRNSDQNLHYCKVYFTGSSSHLLAVYRSTHKATSYFKMVLICSEGLKTT